MNFFFWKRTRKEYLERSRGNVRFGEMKLKSKMEALTRTHFETWQWVWARVSGFWSCRQTWIRRVLRQKTCVVCYTVMWVASQRLWNRLCHMLCRFESRKSVPVLKLVGRVLTILSQSRYLTFMRRSLVGNRRESLKRGQIKRNKEWNAVRHRNFGRYVEGVVNGEGAIWRFHCMY